MAKQIDWLKGENRSSIIDVTPQYETPGEDSFNNSQQENGILKRELRELKQSREEMNEEIDRLKIKVDRKKNELKKEQSITNTFSQLIEELNRKIEELNRKIEELKNAKVPDNTIQGKTNIQNPILNEEMIEKIVIEKTGLESQVREQIEEIKSLNSQLNLTKEQFEIISIEKSTQQKETEERLQQELDKLEREQIFQNKEQEKQIIDLKTSLEQSGREIIEKERHIQEIEGRQGDELLAAKEQIDNLKSHYSSKDDELKRANKELEELVNKNNELQREVNRSGEECKELSEANERIKKMNEKGQNGNSEEMQMKLNDLEHKNAELENQIQQLGQNQEQINDLKSSLEQSEKKFTEKEREVQEIEGVKLKIENELNQARIEFNEKTESSEDSETSKGKIEQLTKTNSDLDKAVQILSEKNKKYKQEHSKVTQELQDANTKHLEMQHNLEKSISEAEMKSTTEIKELNENKQKQETELKAVKDQVQLLTKQNNEHRKTRAQCKQEIKIMEGINRENKQAREELEVKLKGLNERATEMLEQQKSDYDDLNHVLQRAREELEGEKDNLVFLNKDIANQGQTIIKLREELEQANGFKITFEDKLREMSKEIADRDAKIQQLFEEIENIQVDTHFPESNIPQSDSDLNLERNVSPVQSEKAKGQAKVGVTKISADKPQRTKVVNPITPILNPTFNTPVEIKYRGVNIRVLKLEALPNPTTHARKQIVCKVKKNYELGTLVDIFEVKVGKKTVKAWYVGIRLNEPLGDSDGAFLGIQHFMCEPKHGYFSPFEDVYVPVA